MALALLALGLELSLAALAFPPAMEAALGPLFAPAFCHQEGAAPQDGTAGGKSGPFTGSCALCPLCLAGSAAPQAMPPPPPGLPPPRLTGRLVFIPSARRALSAPAVLPFQARAPPPV
jgi:hypothetical protein